MEKFSFFDALTYGVRTLFWRPIRSLLFIAAMSLIYYVYFLWAQSGAGMAFYTGYAESTTELIAGNYGSYFKSMGLMMVGSMIVGCIMLAGAYRVYVRDEPIYGLPVQLGADELRTFGVYIAITIILVGIMMVAMIPLVILVMILSFIVGSVMGGGTADPAMASTMGGMIGIIAMLPLMFFVFYAMGRLSVSLAMTIRDKKFRLGGWQASKGVGLQLLSAHIVLYLVMIIIQFSLMPGYWATLTQSMTDPMAMQDSAAMMEMMTNPYGDNLLLILPIQMLTSFLLFGPTAAVANWDARKAAENPEAVEAQ